ncbi:hypothetical protein GW17_00018536 [Ensete ventricosum]|nr:hypothetical protein GW17_00018536 [Ensete ventricosum]RZS04499.1 hypothetical protein BHM03_00034849 [Ensete ventricosum]
METNRRCVECVDQVLEFVADKKITMSSCVLHRHGDVGHRIEPSESFMASAPLRRRLAGAPDMNKRCDLLVAPPPSSASLATHSSAGPSTPPAAPRRRLPARSLPSAAPFASLPSKSTIQGRGPGRILSDAVLRSKATAKAMASSATLFTPVTLVSRPALSNQRVVAPQTRRCKIPIVSASVSAQPFVAAPDDLVASILSKVRSPFSISDIFFFLLRKKLIYRRKEEY